MWYHYTTVLGFVKRGDPALLLRGAGPMQYNRAGKRPRRNAGRPGRGSAMDWKDKYEPIFEDVCLKKYLVKPDFKTIERKLAHLRTGDPITYADLEAIAREDLWIFDKYWLWPAREQIENDLERTADVIIDPVAKAGEEPDMIHALLDIFRNISLVSILLRFVWPEHYAIYSRPCLQVLRIERGYDDVEEFMNYVSEMRTLRTSFGLDRTADVDMIVWAISQRHEGFDDLRRLISERLPQALPLSELLKHAVGCPIRVADAYLAAGDHRTAGYWAARAFEKVVRSRCAEIFGYVPRNYGREVGNIEYLIQCVSEDAKDSELHDLMFKMKNLRNAAIHVERPFNTQMAEELIRGVKEIAEKLDVSC